MKNMVAILFGSSNEKGNTKALLEEISNRIDTSIFKLQDYKISPFDYSHKNINDDFIPLIEKLLEFDQIIFASPVYWYAMSAQMKIFFDRISDLLHVRKDLSKQLRSKTCAILATGASPEPERCFEEAFINSFDYLSMDYKGMLYCYCEDSFILLEHEKHIRQQLKVLTS